MSTRTKVLLIGSLFLYGLIVVGVMLLKTFQREDFNSPASASRDTYGFREGRLGLLEKSDTKVRAVWPATEVMAIPERFEGLNDSFVLDWGHEGKLNGPVEDPPSPWVEGLQGDDQAELVAFASWVPGAEDPVTEANWEVKLIFRDPIHSQEISAEALAALGVPESFTRLSPPQKYQTPVLRLLFRTAGMEYARSPSLVVGDSRTGAQVSYDLDEANDGSARQEVSGSWMRLDTDLLLWHDTPLTCHVQFLTGEVEIRDLPRSPGAQVDFGDHLRLQWLARVDRPVDVGSDGDDFAPSSSISPAVLKRLKDYDSDGIFIFTPEKEKSPATRAIFRSSSPDTLIHQCGILTGPGAVTWDWDKARNDDGVAIATAADEGNPDTPMRVVFVPHRTELTFSLTALPDMPNRRSTTDLFDNVLPRITLPDDLDDAETQLHGFIGTGAQVAWKSSDRWDDHPPRQLPADRTFRNTSPQKLLDWYLDHTDGAWVRYDPDGLVLHLNQEEPSLWSRMDEGFERFFQSLF